MAAHSALCAEIDLRRRQAKARLATLTRATAHQPGFSRRAKKFAHPIDQVEVRAHAIVAGMAELEAMVRESVQSVHEELNSQGLRVSALRPNLRQLICQGSVQSLQSSPRHEREWSARLQITTMDQSREVAVFPTPRKGPIPPLDGRTITAAQLGHIGIVYDLPNRPWASGVAVGHLKKLALLRNDIAHGNQTIDEIFRGSGTELTSVIAYLQTLRDLIDVIADSWISWLGTRSYV